MCSEHGYGPICPSAQDCLLSALTLMPSLCRDQELGPSQPVDHSFLLPAKKALLTASLSSPTRCFTSKWVPQSERTEDFVSGNQGTGTAEISRFSTS